MCCMMMRRADSVLSSLSLSHVQRRFVPVDIFRVSMHRWRICSGYILRLFCVNYLQTWKFGSVSSCLCSSGSQRAHRNKTYRVIIHIFYLFITFIISYTDLSRVVISEHYSSFLYVGLYILKSFNFSVFLFTFTLFAVFNLYLLCFESLRNILPRLFW